MTVSKSQMKATAKYVKNNYDRIEIKTTKGLKEKIKKMAEAEGESLNAFINKAIMERMERLEACER